MKIISISGRINSGKDTVGKAIQILIDSPHFTDQAVVDFMDKEDIKYSYEIKKFGEKLKQVVCLLTNCKRKDLESHDFKASLIGPQWTYFKLQVPNINSGILMTISNIFVNEKDAFSYADNLGYSQKVIKVEEHQYTYRKLMLVLGTEAGRKIIHPNIWVNALLSDLTESSKWIITDTRFVEEINSVISKKAICIRVNRENLDKNEADEHQSENDLNDHCFDYEIYNSKEKVNLIKAVRKILKKEGFLTT